MALGTTRAELIEMLRDETRSSSNSSRSLDNLAYLVRLIRRYNETITDEFAWPYMDLAKTQAQKTMAAGQRYYDFPVKLSIEHIQKVWFKQATGNVWVPLDQGIRPDNYNETDSDDDERADPVVAWDFITDTNDNLQFEVWPMPATNGGIVWFEGRKKHNPLNDAADRADHDDQLIVLRSAAEALKAKSKGDSDMKAALAGDRFQTLKSRLTNPRMATIAKPAYYSVNRRKQRFVAVFNDPAV